MFGKVQLSLRKVKVKLEEKFNHFFSCAIITNVNIYFKSFNVKNSPVTYRVKKTN